MQTYTLKEIKAIAKEQGYSFACLFNNEGDKIVNFNNTKQNILDKLIEIEKKLNSKIISDGVYFVGLANKLGKGQHIDKLAVLKGSNLAQGNQQGTVIIQQAQPAESILSYAAALDYQKQISSLEYDNKFLKQQNDLLQKKINELESELKEVETLSESSENKGGLTDLIKDSGGILKGLAEAALPALDRYFDIQQKRIELEEKKLMLTAPKKQQAPAAPKQIEIGSKEHLQLIEKAYNDENEEELNKHLDALEQHLPDLYLQVMEKLNLSTNE